MRSQLYVATVRRRSSGIPPGEKRVEGGSDLVGALLGEEVSAVESPPGELRGDAAPDRGPAHVATRVTADQPLGKVGQLDQEEVAPHAGCASMVECLVDRPSGHDIQCRYMRDRAGVVEREP